MNNKTDPIKKIRIPWNKGKKLSKEHCKNLSLSHMGQEAWNKGKPLSEEHRKNVSISCKRVASDPKDKRHSIEWRKQASEANKIKIANGCRVGSKWSKYILKSGEVVTVRSNTELNCIKLLEALEVKFQYENLKIKYIGKDGENHTWITDFYFPDYNLIVDTKYGDYYKDFNLGLKINTAKSLGYRVLVLDFELYNGNPEPSLIMQMIKEGVETIPKGSRVANYISQLEVPSPV